MLLQFCASSPRFRDIGIWNMWLWKARSRSKCTTFRNDAIQWQMLKSINITSCSFALAFTVFEILTFEVLPWKSRSRSKSTTFKWQHSQWCHLIANTDIDIDIEILIANIYKCNLLQFCASSHFFRDIDFWNSWPWKSRSMSQSTTLAMS